MAIVDPILTEKTIAFSEWEISVLRTLLQDHLNTVSDISSHYVHAGSVEYTESLYGLELKLIAAENA